MNTLDHLVAVFGLEVSPVKETEIIVYGMLKCGSLTSVYVSDIQVKINYTQDQKNRAIERYTLEHKGDQQYGSQLVGSIVHLKRSRKAPNKKDLLVIGYEDRYFDNRFNCWVDEKLTVKDQETNLIYTVSYNCYDRTIKADVKLPFYLQD